MSDGVVEASSKGRKLIEVYQDALERKERAERELNAAACAKTNARNDLAKWLMPADAKPGEKFSIWNQDKYGNECLFEVTTPSSQISEPSVVLRYRK